MEEGRAVATLRKLLRPASRLSMISSARSASRRVVQKLQTLEMMESVVMN